MESWRVVAIDISLSPKVESSEEGLQIHRARKAQTTRQPAHQPYWRLSAHSLVLAVVT
jgi:hypothetical protein